MKKYLNFAFVSAIALTGTLGFIACSSEDKLDADSKNPDFNSSKNEVVTKFVFNVASGNTTDTRQTEVATQASSSLSAENFRGIDNAQVMCFEQPTDGNYLTTPLTATKTFDMSRVCNPGTLSNSNSRRVLEMSLPINTNSMVIYGKAINDANTKLSYNIYGHLDAYNVNNDLTQTYFQLGRRLTAEDKAAFQQVQKLLAACMTCYMNVNRGTVSITAADTPQDGVPAYGFPLPSDYKPNMPWSAYYQEDANHEPLSPVDNAPARPLEIKLYKVYKEMVNIQTAELRNASGVALKATITSLWSIVNSVRCATPTNQEEALAKYMAQLINEELQKYFSAISVPTDGGAVTGVSIKRASDLISALSADSYWPAEATAASHTKPESSEFSAISTYSSTQLGDFPKQFELPQGSTHILFIPDEKYFYYAVNYNTSAVGEGTFTVDDYYYPAELCYFGNSELRVSDEDHVVADYPENVGKWNSDATTSWSSDWAVAHVQTSTHSVAMRRDINYGTSLLKTTVGYNTLTLKDNNHAIQQRDYGINEEDKTITISDVSSFQLVGVVIGDQWPKVGWDFLPKTTDTDPNYRKGFIYDSQIAGNGVIPASTSSTSSPNYTLVFDNYVDLSGTDPNNRQPSVYVALEFTNNTGVDFFGKDNLITNGSNFYLIGQLDPTGKSGPDKPQWHALPPYDAHDPEYETKTVPRVFIQDHMTTANFKIDTNSLHHAYLTVPDLRSSSVTLGLSVDVTWSAGLVFDNVIIGGN